MMDANEKPTCCSQDKQPRQSVLCKRDQEFVALGAALASNCVPCIEYHIREARNAKLTDAEIAASIELADKIRRVPAGKVFDAASRLLAEPLNEQPAGSECTPVTAGASCC